MAFCDAIRQFPSFLRLLLLLLLALASAAEIRNKTIRIRSLVLPFPPIARSVTAISPCIYCNDPSNGKTRGRRLGAEHERSFVHSSSYISLALFLYYIRMSFRGSLTQSKSHWHLLAFSSFRFVAAAAGLLLLNLLILLPTTHTRRRFHHIIPFQVCDCVCIHGRT